jgi:tetratricopeptide (TPR) repeat protein
MTKAHAWTPEQGHYFYKAAGNCASRMDDYEKSIGYHERNVEICRHFKDTINLWQALNDLSVPYFVAGQFDKAIVALRECYEPTGTATLWNRRSMPAAVLPRYSLN